MEVEKEHHWPRHRASSSSRSIGSVFYEQCNNCLAMRIWHIWMVQESNGEWIEKTSEIQIVEDPRKTVKE